jgi:hypothetical protein
MRDGKNVILSAAKDLQDHVDRFFVAPLLRMTN